METTTRHTEDLSLNTSTVRKLLVDFLRDGIRKPGLTKGIIGLSGGVDSTVVAYLTVEALGKRNVVGVIMPYKTSSPQSRVDAELVAETLGIATEVVEITPMVDAYLTAARISDRIRAGNVMARQRMIILFDVSYREQGMVVGTSNKTEVFLGYGTLFGDMACSLNPLGDLYKTQVWQLAAAMGVPKHIIDKNPTADLWEGQTDEGELGFSYKRVDLLLYHMIDERRGSTELVKMGFEEGFVVRVEEIIRKTQFKRRLPIVAKVSNRTVNVDFRYARDWGI